MKHFALIALTAYFIVSKSTDLTIVDNNVLTKILPYIGAVPFARLALANTKVHPMLQIALINFASRHLLKRTYLSIGSLQIENDEYIETNFPLSFIAKLSEAFQVNSNARFVASDDSPFGHEIYVARGDPHITFKWTEIKYSFRLKIETPNEGCIEILDGSEDMDDYINNLFHVQTPCDIQFYPSEKRVVANQESRVYEVFDIYILLVGKVLWIDRFERIQNNELKKQVRKMFPDIQDQDDMVIYDGRNGPLEFKCTFEPIFKTFTSIQE